MKKKILFLDASQFFGGAEAYVKDYIAELSRFKDLEIYGGACCSARYPIDEKNFYWINIGSLRKRICVINWYKMWSATSKLKKYIKKRNINVVITNHVRSQVIGMFLKILLGKKIKLIFFMHEIFLSRFVFRLISWNADKICFATDYVQNYYSRNNKNSSVIYNGIDFKGIEKRRKVRDDLVGKLERFKGNAKLVGMVGYFYPWKGQMEFLKLAREIQDENVKFVLIGGSQEAEGDSVKFGEKLEEFIDQNGLRDKVFITKKVEDAIPFMDLCDVVVHGSLKPEPFGRVVLEALILRKSVIVSDKGGVKDLVNQKFQINPNDLDRRKDILLDLLSGMSKFESNVDLTKYDLGQNAQKFYSLF